MASCRWIFENEVYKTWFHDETRPLLWIHGDPGQGKTMLICGLIDHLKSRAGNSTVSYFLCQATDSSINSATSALRGLLFLLLSENRSLMSHIRNRYKDRGRRLFEDASAWFALAEILRNVLQDAQLGPVYLIVDAMDECVSDRDKLLSLIFETSSPQVRWIVSSRRWGDIERQMRKMKNKVCLYLDSSADFIISAVDAYIDYKVDQMAAENEYEDETKHLVLKHLSSYADGTFLWVALVCQNLEKIEGWDVLSKLYQFPPGLDNLYDQMISQIKTSDHHANLCLQVLATMTVLKRPVSLVEIVCLVEGLGEYSDNTRAITSIIDRCRSYLIIKTKMIGFVHQSAKDYLLENFNRIFNIRADEMHYNVFSRSLNLLLQLLCRNIIDIKLPGICPKDIPMSDSNPLGSIAYASTYWVEHLMDSQADRYHQTPFQTTEVHMLEKFMRKKLLNWLETLSLLRSLEFGVRGLRNLEGHPILKDMMGSRASRIGESSKGTAGDGLLEAIADAYRFLRYHRDIIEQFPLQVYTSALIFSPSLSITRRHCLSEEPAWIDIKPSTSPSWSPCSLVLSTQDFVRSAVDSIFFSPEQNILVVESKPAWFCCDADTGAVLARIQESQKPASRAVVHDETLSRTAAFVPDGRKLITIHEDGVVRSWCTAMWRKLGSIDFSDEGLEAVGISHKGHYIMFIGERDGAVRFYDVMKECAIRTFGSLSSMPRLPPRVHFSSQETSVAVSIYDSTSDCGAIEVWDVVKGRLIHTVASADWLLAISPTGNSLITGGDKKPVKLWDLDLKTKFTITKEKPDLFPLSAVLSPNQQVWAIRYIQQSIALWDANQRVFLHMLGDQHHSRFSSITFAPNIADMMVTGQNDGSLNIWSKTGSQLDFSVQEHAAELSRVVFHPNGHLLASVCRDRKVKVWEMKHLMKCIEDEPRSNQLARIWKSNRLSDMKTVAFASQRQITTWDNSTGRLHSTFNEVPEPASFIASSPTGERVAILQEGTAGLKYYDTASGDLIGEWTDAGYTVEPSPRNDFLIFSESGKTLVCSSGYMLHFLDCTQMPLKSKLTIVREDDRFVHHRSPGDRCGDCIFDSKHNFMLMVYPDFAVWEIDSGKRFGLDASKVQKPRRSFAALSQDTVALLQSPERGEEYLEVWDIGSGQIRFTSTMELNGIPAGRRLCYSADGMSLLVCKSNRPNRRSVSSVDIWDVASGTVRMTLDDVSLYEGSVLSRDGRFLASGRAARLHIWSLETGQLLHGGRYRYSLESAAFSPDNTSLITNHGVIWDDATAGVELPSRLTISEKWALLNGHKLLRLPDFYDMAHVYVSGSTILLGGPRGVTSIKFNLQKAAESLGIKYVPPRD